jgi:hypothetical protein
LKIRRKASLMDRAHRFSSTTVSLVSGTVLAVALFFTTVPRLRAESYDHCQRRIAHAEHEVHLAVERHGRNSRKADHERLELHEARERCWRERHQWWDEREHRWHAERDWDDHDRD